MTSRFYMYLSVDFKVVVLTDEIVIEFASLLKTDDMSRVASILTVMIEP